MRNTVKRVLAGGSVLGAAALMTVGAGAASGHAAVPVASIHLVASHTVGGVAGADQAAVAYVNTNYPGSGVANVLTTVADTEFGVAVYDVRIVAPNGSTYALSVQQSNDAVLSATLAENQVTTTPTTTTPPTTTSPVITPPPNVPTVIAPLGGVESESGDVTEATGSTDSGSSAEDTQVGTSVGISGGTSTDTQGGSSTLGASTDGSTSSGGGDNQVATTPSASGSSDATTSSSTSSDG